MHASPLNIGALRVLTPREQIRTFQESEFPPEVITHTLLQAVGRGSITPAIFRLWLCVSPASLKQALQQDVSIEVRRCGIQALRKGLDSPQWKDIWDGLGGTAGLIELLAEFSVHEVRMMCVTIGKAARKRDVQKKRRAFTPLLEATLPRLFPGSTHATPDGRPLARYYPHLAPSCTPQVVTAILYGSIEGDWTKVREKDYAKLQSDTLKDLIVQSVVEGQRLPKWLSAFFWEASSGTQSVQSLKYSIEFSLEVLRMVIDQIRSSEWNCSLMRSLIQQLARRCIKKRNGDLADELIELALRFLEKRPETAKQLGFESKGFVHLVALRWGRHSLMTEQTFKQVLTLSKKNSERPTPIADFTELLSAVPRSRRYELLRFCYHTTTQKDLNVETDLVNAKVGSLPSSLFLDMEPGQGLGLFTRLVNATGGIDITQTDPLISVGSHYTATGFKDPSAVPSCEVFHIVLLHRNGKVEEAEALAKSCIDAHKKASMRKPDPYRRGVYAQSTIDFAFASKSLELLKEVYTWLQRFVRDPQTIDMLFGNHTKQEVGLLSGMPDIVGDVDTAALRSNVKAANSILQLLFETACSSLREPSHNPNIWRGTLGLFYQAVNLRIQRSAELYKAGRLGDDELHSMVWEDTLRLLVETDEIGLKPGHERLGIDIAGGILRFGSRDPIHELTDQPSSTYCFLNNLAIARDQLWRKFRPTVHPAAATLPEPYPRGLPIQNLTGPFMVMAPNLQRVAPYFAKRANATVFPDVRAASTRFPEDEEARKAIGYFVDDYLFALKMLVPKTPEETERKKRTEMAWVHAVEGLSESRMDREEATRYWQCDQWNTYIEFWPRERKPDLEITEWPIVPSVDDPAEVVEWNPLPRPIPEIKPRELEEPAYIDVSKKIHLFRRSTNDNIFGEIKFFSAHVPGQKFDEAALWSSNRSARARRVPAMREGQILAAILYIDTSSWKKTRILSSPFPSVDDLRYPATYLDDEGFLELHIQEALDFLELHIKHVPPVLLEQLAQNSLERLSIVDRKDVGSLSISESIAFGLIRLLALSDRPRLATQMAVRTIIQYPDSSSWHRMILSPRLFNRLSSADTRECFADFATAIITALEEQEKHKKLREAKAALKESKGDAMQEYVKWQPYVKVTTVKFLAQLLNGTPFVTEGFAVDLLSTLMQKASHVDIRNAIVESLLSILSTAQPHLGKRILKSLEDVIPLVGALNERRPFNKSDWEAFQNSLDGPTLPMIDNCSRENTPMLTQLLSFPGDVQSFAYKQEYVDRIILPILKHMQQEMKRWLRLCLVSLSAPPTLLDHLPVPPRNIQVWNKVMRHFLPYLPVSLLQEQTQYIKFCINPHPAIAEINNTLRESALVKRKPYLSTWLALYDPGVSVVRENIMYHYPHVLRDTTLHSGGITAQAVQESFLKIFEAAVRNDSPHHHHVGYLMNEMGVKGQVNSFKGVRIVQNAIQCIDNFRTPDWIRSKSREPAVLPDTFPLRLLLLPSLDTQSKTIEIQEEECKHFATEISSLVDEIAGSRYHHKLELIKKSFAEVTHVSDRILVALHLGDVSGLLERCTWSDVRVLLRIELADVLIGHAGLKNARLELRQRVESLVESWKKSDDEEVRRIAYTWGHGGERKPSGRAYVLDWW